MTPLDTDPARAVREKHREYDLDPAAHPAGHTDAEEEESLAEAKRMPAKLLYEAIRRDGVEEMRRPAQSLFWSGITAGILISMSVIGMAVLHAALPDTPWAGLVSAFGYTLGFLLVIGGRMQLFTENTITTVLPVVAEPTRKAFGCVARLWAIVLGANIVGTIAAAMFIAWTPAFGAELQEAVAVVSRHATEPGPRELFFKAMPAGLLIAALVWMMPMAESARPLLVVLITWLIAAGGFAHVVAGTVETAYLVLLGEVGIGRALFGIFLPVLAGNVVGGTAIFTLMAWAQVAQEVQPEDDIA